MLLSSTSRTWCCFGALSGSNPDLSRMGRGRSGDPVSMPSRSWVGVIDSSFEWACAVFCRFCSLSLSESFVTSSSPF